VSGDILRFSDSQIPRFSDPPILRFSDPQILRSLEVTCIDAGNNVCCAVLCSAEYSTRPVLRILVRLCNLESWVIVIRKVARARLLSSLRSILLGNFYPKRPQGIGNDFSAVSYCHTAILPYRHTIAEPPSGTDSTPLK
jgi:hypothetical protein